jgi:hypothetical protein
MWIVALINAAPNIVFQIAQYLRSRGHEAAAGDLELLLASTKADYLTVINNSRVERGLPPLTSADLENITP